MFGKNIKKIRNVKGLSQQAFAELFELKRGTLGAYEEGRSNPKLETIAKMASYFKVTVDELLYSELTVNRLLHFNDTITTNTEALKVEAFANIPCITPALQLDFIQHHAKKHFQDRLPCLQLPLDPHVEYIGYTVTGLEMTYQDKGFFPKDIVVGKKINSTDYKKMKTDQLVLVLTADRLLFRHAHINNDSLILKANHLNIESIALAFDEVVCMWEICHVFHYCITPKSDWVEDRLSMLEKEILQLKGKK